MDYKMDHEFKTEAICSACTEELFLGMKAESVAATLSNTAAIERRYTLDHAIHVDKFDELSTIEDDSEGAWISRPWLRGQCMFLLAC